VTKRPGFLLSKTDYTIGLFGLQQIYSFQCGFSLRTLFLIISWLPWFGKRVKTLHLQEFFNYLYPKFNQNMYLIEIRAFSVLKEENDPGIRRFFFAKTEDAVHKIRELAETKKYQIYFECPELKPGARNGQEDSCLRYPFLYADLDAKEKNSEGKVVKEYTRKMLMQRIKGFALAPSIIVNSGHGYHLYWLLDMPVYDKSIMQLLLDRICAGLGSDKQTRLLTQILRPPETWNLKGISEGNLPLPVQVEEAPLYRYSLKEVYSALKIDIRDLASVSRSAEKRTGGLQGRTKAGTGIIFAFKNPPKPLNIEVDNFPDLLDALKKQNMFLASNMAEHKPGVAFNCLFHSDDNPSANVFRSKSGYYYYKCFGCGKLSDIISICQETQKKTFAETIVFLCKFFGIRFEYQSWITDQLYKYYQNAQLIDSFEEHDYHRMYPYLYKYLKPRWKYLVALNQYGLAKISSDMYSYKGENLFFISYRYFCAKYRYNLTTTQNAINLFATLGLIEKVGLNDLPPAVAKKAIEESMKRKGPLDPEVKRPVNFYIFPNLRDRLQQADDRARELVENNFTIRNCMNKNYLLLNFDKETANEVYNDNREISKRSLSIANSLEKTLKNLIASQGYATKNMIVSKTKPAGRLKATRQDKEKELDRHLPLFLKNNNLEYVTANKKLKEMYGIKGSIKVIVPIGEK
jgi:hypothetical protein